MPSRADGKRLTPELSRAIGEALLFLRDTQIRERGRCRDARYDATGPEGVRAWRVMGRETLEGRPLGGHPFGRIRNRAGEWSCFVNIMPNVLGRGMPRSLVRYHDSNLFTPASIVYPLFLIDESPLPAEKRLLEPVIDAAVENLAGFERNGGFTFWPQIEPASSEAECVGPMNIPHAGNGMRLMKLMPEKAFKTASATWYRDGFDPEINPYGNDAFSNLPADADDTSLMTCLLRLREALSRRTGPGTGAAGLAETLIAWRDLDRARHDYRNEWMPQDSGAFLTWLRDEAEPTFADPTLGVIPSGVNNVDPVVNANVLCALGLLGMHRAPGVEEALGIVVTALEADPWEDRTIYYPQRMMLPYTFARAYRDGGYRNDLTDEAAAGLVARLLDMQEPDGGFPGGPDATRDLSTALGLCALLDLGAAAAASTVGLEERYGAGIDAAIALLLARRRRHPLRHPQEVAELLPDGVSPTSAHWDAGIHYAASRWSIGQWRSEALTTAIAAEALIRYALGFDLDPGASILTCRLVVDGYGPDGPVLHAEGVSLE